MPWVTGAVAIAVAGAMLLPLAYLIIRVTGEGADAWDAVTSRSTVEAVVRTAALAGAVTAGTVAIGVPAAWLTARTDVPLRPAWSALLALPLAIPSYVAAFAYVSALGPGGPLRERLEAWHLGFMPEPYGFFGAWLILTLVSFPYVYLPAVAALGTMDRSLEEAARALGRTRARVFFEVTLPLLRPAIAGGGLLAALYALSDFGVVSITRFDSLTRIIYVQYTSALDRAAAAALALLLVGLAGVVVLIESVARGRAYGRAAGRPADRVRLGHWRWLALAFCGAVVTLALVLPVSVIAYWLVRGLNEGESMSFVRGAGINSVYASSLAAVVAVAAAVPVAVLAVRHAGPVSWLIERASFTGFALPGITVALALVFFAVNYALPLYQTLALLVFAYVVRFLPQALTTVRTAIERIDPRTEEAARGLGHSPFSVLSRITAPQMLPGMVAGAQLVFLTSMKELPATLLLSPIGFDTLATEIWSATSEAFYTRAALPALLLVAISAVPMLISTGGERRPE